MKQFRYFLFACVVAMGAFTTIFYSSCRKDFCIGVTCYNMGYCSGGNCVCPTGFTGNQCQYETQTTLTYTNNTFTQVYITVGGVQTTIPVGGQTSFTGTPGSLLSATAYTSGTTSSGTVVGETINWDLSDYFPTSGTAYVDLNVSSTYFYLKISNTSSYDINKVYVNYGLSSQTLDNITVYNTGYTYGIGYYRAYTNTNLYLTSGSHYWNYDLYLSFTTNQSYTFNAY